MVQKIRSYQPNFPASANFAQGIHSGLNFTHTGGLVAGKGDVVETAAGSVAVPNGTWGVYIDLTDGVLKAAATASLPVADSLILYTGTAISGNITSVADVRSWTAVTDSSGVAVGDWDTEIAALNPLLWFAFDEASGTLDNKGSLGANWDLTSVVNSPIYEVTGQLGIDEAVSYDQGSGGADSDAHRRTPTMSSNPFSSGGGTVLILMKRDGDQGTQQTIGGFEDGGPNDQGLWFRCTSNDAHRITVAFQDGSGTLSAIRADTNAGQFGDGTWHLAGYVFEPPNDTELFMNGINVDSSVVNAAPPATDFWLSDFGITWTNVQFGNKSAFFDGLTGVIDELVVIDNVQLTSGQQTILKLAAGL